MTTKPNWRLQISKLESDVASGGVAKHAEELSERIKSCLDFLDSRNQRLDRNSESEDTEKSEESDEDWKVEVEKHEHFLTVTLPKVVRIALNQKVIDEGAQKRIGTVLQEITRLIVSFFKDGYDLHPLFALLVDIFDDSYPFYYFQEAYMNSGSPAFRDIRTLDIDDAPWAPQNPTASRYFVQNINTFGDLGGFEDLLNRVQEIPADQQPPLFVKNASTIFFAITQLRKYLRMDKALEDWVIRLPSLKDLLLSIPDKEFKQVTRKEIRTIVTGIEIFYLCYFQEIETAKHIEQMQFEIALKALKCSSLNKRLDGLHQINVLIDMVVRREDQCRGKYYPSHQGSRQPSPPVAKWLDAQTMVQWIIHCKVIELLFDSRIHHQLVRRSGDIFKLLASKRLLEPRFIDLLWDSTLGKGRESIQQAVYDIIIEISHLLHTSQLESFLSKTESLPLESIDSMTMKLQKYLTTRAMRETGGGVQEEGPTRPGLMMFWKWIQDEGGLSIPLQSEAIQCLSEIITHIPGNHRFWIQTCVSNISEGKSVPQSLELLQNTLDSIVPSHTSYHRHPQVIDQIEEQFDLMDILFSDLARYKRDVADAIAKASLSQEQIEQTDWNVEKLASSRPYLVELSVRLEFLIFLLRSSSLLVLSITHIDQLWDSLITNSICHHEREQCFQWFQEVCGTKSARVLQNDECEHVFLKKLCQLPVASLEVGGFSCWEHYFAAVNGIADKSREWYDDSKTFIVYEFDLLGIEYLWHVVFTCQNQAVVEEGIGRLLNLHKQLSPFLQASRTEIRENSIRTVMNRLSELADKPPEEAKPFILRAIEILKTFVVELEGSPGTDPVTVHLRHRGGNGKVSIDMYESDMMVALRDRLADRISKPCCVVRLLDHRYHHYSEGDLSQYNLKPFELKKDSIFWYEINPMYNEAELTKPRSKVDLASMPSYILANTQEFFDQLWGLLSFGDAVSSQIWELISMIPTNSRLTSLLTSLTKDTCWSQVLDSTSTHRLEYALRIMKSIINDRESDCDRAHWILEFEQFGGVEHMYNVFFKQDLEKIRNHLTPACLASLLDVLGFFLLVGITVEGEEEKSVEGRLRGSRLMLDDDKVFSVRQLRSSMVSLKDSVGAEDAIAARLDFSLITMQLLRVIESAAKATLDHPDADEGEVVGQAAKLLFSTIFSRPEHVQKLLSFSDLKGFIRLTVLETREPRIRNEVANGIVRLVTRSHYLGFESNSLLESLVPMLFSFLDSLPVDSSVSDSYFLMLHEIIRDYFIVTERLSASQSLDTSLGTSSDLNASQPPFQIEEYISLQDLLLRCSQLLKSHPCLETSDEDPPDEKLVGLLGLIEVLCYFVVPLRDLAGPESGEGLLHQIFYNCLFELPLPSSPGEAPSVTTPKCKTAKSRTNALKALRALCIEANRSYYEVLELMDSLHLHIFTDSNPWGYSPSTDCRSKVGYAGIKNLGCICYMNSLLQQFYMIPFFRRGILSIDFESIEGKKPEADQLKPGDNPIYQLQMMYAYLKETQKRYYNPRPFTQSYKDSSGNSIDVCVQMDVDEFFNSLCDKLDNYLKGTPQSGLLKNLFMGKEAMQLIGQTCNHRKENECDFNVITLTIKGKNSILDALQSFVEGDLLDGDNAYFCEGCDKKVDTLKRTCIKTLPNTLILHLKRFDFDFDTMRNEKVNDFCEFPMELDMEPYTREGLAKREREKKQASGGGEGEEGEGEGDGERQGGDFRDPPIFPREEYEYELRGILIHRGVADSGHYYSFIKEREGEGNWVEFNDEVVKPFSIDDLAQECFGGEETVSQYNEHTKGYVQRSLPITRNAYMLIYERKVPKGVSVSTDSPSPKRKQEEEERQTEEKAEEISDEKENPSEEKDKKKEVETFEWAKEDKVPESLYEEVWKHNMKHQQDIWVFDKGYIETLLHLLKTGFYDGGEPVGDIEIPKDDIIFRHLKAFGKGFLSIVSHSKEKSLIIEYAAIYKRAVVNHIPAARWLLKMFVEFKRDGKSLLNQMLLQCNVAETREAVASLILGLFKALFCLEEKQFVEFGKKDQFEENEPTFRYRKKDEGTPITLRLMRDLFVLIKTLPFHWRHFSEYFLLLREIFFSYPLIRAYFLNVKILPRLFDIFLGEDSPNARRSLRKMGDKYSKPNYRHLLSLISMIVCTYELEDESFLKLKSQLPCELPEIVDDMLTMPAFRKRLTDQEATILDDSSRMLAHLCFENEGMSSMILGWLAEGIHKAEYYGLKPYFRIMLPVIDLEDSYQEHRVDTIMRKILKTFNSFKECPMFTKTCLEFTLSLRSNSHVKEWTEKNAQKWGVVEEWLRVHSENSSHYKPKHRPIHLQGWAPYAGDRRTHLLWED